MTYSIYLYFEGGRWVAQIDPLALSYSGATSEIALNSARRVIEELRRGL